METEASDLEIILASASPRRRELLALTGWSFRVCASPISEEPEPGERPDALATRLAVSKAWAARAACPESTVIIAADTMVIHEGRILGKPLDEVEAMHMLQRLRDAYHEVISAVSIQVDGGSPLNEICRSQVPMRAYQDHEVQQYIAGGSPLDKAGAYGIQDPDFHPVAIDRFYDCFANVMGLPLCHLARALRACGYAPPSDVPVKCMQFTGYDCTIYPTILGSDH